MQTLSEENYLKAIFHLEKSGPPKVSVTQIAESLKVNPPSVIVMLRKLSEKFLIEYDKRQGARLSVEGRKVAVEVIRKHRLWEVFLHEKLGFGWEEIHDIAEQLEHVQHPELARRLDKYLGCPAFDPHGDPIPNEEGKMVDDPMLKLSDAALGQSYRVKSVADSSKSFLQFMEQMQIGLGTRIEILEKMEYDGSLLIYIQKRNKAVVSKGFSDNIWVS